MKKQASVMTRRRIRATAFLSAALAVVALVLFAAPPDSEAANWLRWFKRVPLGAQLLPPENGYDATCTLVGVPKQVAPNERFSVAALFQNTGTATWERSKVWAVSLTSSWRSKFASLLYRKYGPGETGVAVLTLMAPSQPGTYPLEVQLAERPRNVFGQACRMDIPVSAGGSSSSGGAPSSSSSSSSTRSDGICNVASGRWCSSSSSPGGDTLSQKANLYITQSVVPARSHQLLGGALGESVLNLTFRAKGGAADVTWLSFLNTASVASLDRLELYKAGSTTPFAHATTTKCKAGSPANTFCVSMQGRQLAIAQDQAAEVQVRPFIKTDSDGGQSGDRVELSLGDLARGENVKAREINPWVLLSPNDGDGTEEGEIFIGSPSPGPNVTIYGLPNDIVMSKIESIANADTNANGTAVQPGVQDIARFRLTAARNVNTKNGLNKAKVYGMYFDVASSNVQFSPSFSLYNAATPSASHTCDAYRREGNKIVDAVTGPFLVLCDLRTDHSVLTAIDEGQSATFVLRANITNPRIASTNTSSFRVSLHEFTEIAKSSFGINASHFLWADEDFGFSKTFLWVEQPDAPVVNGTRYGS